MINKFLFERFISINKQTRFLVSTFLLTMLVLFSTLFFFDKVFIFIPIFIFASYFLTYFSLLEGIEKLEWGTLFFMPIMFTVAFYLFFFLFPVRWLTRLPFLIFYSVSIFAILRAVNIFNVGVEKNLQLYRAAFSVNYFYQTVIIFFLGNFLFSLKLDPIYNGLIIFALIFIFSLHFFWTIKLDVAINKQILIFSLLVGLISGELIILMSFLPFEASIMSLLATALYYSLVGLSYAYLDERFFKETIREYIFVLGFVFVIAFLALVRW